MHPRRAISRPPSHGKPPTCRLLPTRPKVSSTELDTADTSASPSPSQPGNSAGGLKGGSDATSALSTRCRRVDGGSDYWRYVVRRAAPPGNDVIEGAVAAAPGFSTVLDTTDATTDEVDSQLNEFCGAPATDASVWYALTVPSDTGVLVDVSASDYSAGVLVGVGSPGSLAIEACGPGSVGFNASAGTT